MKHRTKNTLRAMAKHLGLKVRFVSYFGDDIHGKLIPREKRILIKAHKPRYEHIFTMLHEFGHYLQHFLKPDRKQLPRLLDLYLENKFGTTIASTARRYFRFIFNKESGKEWEADLWAMCAFLYLAKRVGCRDDLIEFLNRHPEKTRLFWQAVMGLIYQGIKSRVTGFAHLLKPYRAT